MISIARLGKVMFIGFVLLVCQFNGALGQSNPDPEVQQLIDELSLKESDEPIRNHPRWRKPQSIHVYYTSAALGFRADYLNWIKEVTGDVNVIPIHYPTRQMPTVEQVDDAEVFLGWCFPSVFRAATGLRYFLNYGTGIDACIKEPEIYNRDFIFTNSQRLSGPSIAEHIIAMMLSLTRNLNNMRDSQKAQKWERRKYFDSNMIEVSGKTMLVAGLGGIGTEVAKRAHGLGMRVIATRRTSREGPDFVDYVGLSDELFSLAKQARVIVNTMPLTKENRGIFDSAFFTQLSKGSYFISTSRGEHTDTDALMAALEDGTLAGAGLDVTDPEPLPPDHALWNVNNVIISPHISSNSDLGSKRRFIIVRENIRRYVNGEKLLNMVDLERGY